MGQSRGAAAVAVLVTLTLCGAGCSDRRSRGQPSPAHLAPAPSDDGAGSPFPDAAALTVKPVAAEVNGARGQTVTATFRTRPGNSCQLEVRDAGGLTGDRLAPATADDQGLVAWSWTVAGNANPGQATAIVACSGGARGQATLVVS